jgi:dipeptidase E
MSRLLLLSNSTMSGTAFFTWPSPYVKAFLEVEVKEVIFIPYAAVTISYDRYFEIVSAAFGSLGYEVTSVHTVPDKKGAIKNAAALVVGGGNTFALLSRMYEEDLLTAVRMQVAAGVPYVGWSAGANIACPTLMTTNDMPVVMPPSFDALNLVPFQINPHYHELKFENQGGETRRERLEEFLVLNPQKKVIGLPEGMLLLREGNNLVVEGKGIAKLYESGKPVTGLRAGTDASFLLS